MTMKPVKADGYGVVAFRPIEGSTRQHVTSVDVARCAGVSQSTV
jgi:hypothetical protein